MYFSLLKNLLIKRDVLTHLHHLLPLPHLHPHLHLLMHVDLHNGLVTVIVMITTTMKHVVGMVVIAVEMMSTHNIALPANA